MKKRKRLRKKKMMKKFICGSLKISDGKYTIMKRKGEAIVTKYTKSYEDKYDDFKYTRIHCCMKVHSAFERIFKCSMSWKFIHKIPTGYYKDKYKRAKY